MERQFLLMSLPILICLLVLLSPNLLFSDLRPRLVFEAPDALQPLAARLDNRQTVDVETALQLTGLNEPGPPIRVLLAPDSSELAKNVPAWVSGYAVGEQSVIVLLPDRVHSYPARSIENLLTHELTHIMIFRAAGGQRVPRWFDEGLATVATRAWDLEDRARLIWALGTERAVTLNQLNRWFYGDGPTARRAYALASGLVRDLMQRAGRDAPKRILSLVSGGVPFDVAFATVTSSTPARAAASFWDRQTVWIRWAPFVTSESVLWMGITLLAMIAFVLHVRRSAARRRERDIEEDDWGFDEWKDPNRDR